MLVQKTRIHNRRHMKYHFIPLDIQFTFSNEWSTINTVKEIVGHSSYTTTLKYSHLAPAHKNDMAQKRPY